MPLEFDYIRQTSLDATCMGQSIRGTHCMHELGLLHLHVVTNSNTLQPLITLRQASYNYRKSPIAMVLSPNTAHTQYRAVICGEITFLVTFYN